METYKRINKSYRSLFGQTDTEGEESNEGEIERNTETFEARWGWVYNAELIKDFEGITLDEVWQLPIIRALNALAYIKDKRKNEQEQIERLNKKNGRQ